MIAFSYAQTIASRAQWLSETSSNGSVRPLTLGEPAMRYSTVTACARVGVASGVNRINLHLKALSYKYDNFYYADVVGTETYDMNYNDRYFWEYFGLKVHPTLAGHEFMAQQILNALPERGTLPFTDVPSDAWYYDDLYYAWFNGLIKGTSETTFEPDATTTPAVDTGNVRSRVASIQLFSPISPPVLADG